MIPAPPHRLPVLVLTGFLGSGKTTLLNRLLQTGPPSAVLINEFGSTPIDQNLITEQNMPLMTLSGGCVCCQIRGTLAPILKNIRMAWGRPGAPEFARVIIETSGVASPGPVLDTLLRDRWLARNYRLDAIITLLAAPMAEAILDRHAEAQAQVAWADRLWLSQTDLASPAQIERLRARLQRLAPLTPILHGTAGDAALGALTQPLAGGLRRLAEDRNAPDHPYQSLALVLPSVMSWHRLHRFLTMLLARHREIVRVKGVVHLTDPFGSAAIHGVSQYLHPPIPLPSRVSEDESGRLLFITEGPIQPLADTLTSRWHEEWEGAAQISR